MFIREMQMNKACLQVNIRVVFQDIYPNTMDAKKQDTKPGQVDSVTLLW